MFTGIIETVGRVVRTTRGDGGGKSIWIEADFAGGGDQIGDSIATNGVCLTVTALESRRFSIDAGPETLERTTIGTLVAGAKVNLERALTPSSRLGGHLVQGHVDGVGRVRSVKKRENAYDLSIEVESEIARFAIARGSICLDGISLTITEKDAAGFSVSIIPHTWANTTLVDRGVGSGLNVEVDLLARYVDALLESRAASDAPAQPSGLTAEFLSKHGY